MNNELTQENSFSPQTLPNLLHKHDADECFDENFIAQSKILVNTLVDYKELIMKYSCAIKEVETKFEILNKEYNIRHQRNPISSIKTRVKSTSSLVEKLARNNLEFTLENCREEINDIAGVRVICTYIDDIYELADAISCQSDLEIITRKDYIANPKPNGYRSLHLIVRVPVFFSGGVEQMKVEVQIRTIANDFWASLEHQLKYKQNLTNESRIIQELKDCADIIAKTDAKMLNIRNYIDASAEEMTEEEILLEKFRKIDTPI